MFTFKFNFFIFQCAKVDELITLSKNESYLCFILVGELFGHSFWRQQFQRRFKRHSLPGTLIQPGINILYLCFPTVGRSGNASFGFCNTHVLRERVISPPPNPQPRGPGDHSSSGLYPSTCLAWVALPAV